MGRILKKQVENSMGQYISTENTLCTDSRRAYTTYPRKKVLPTIGLSLLRVSTQLKVFTISRM
jgi:hypothetical protein